MNNQLKKAFRDLSGNPRRSLTVVLALVLGLWGVGMVFVSYFVLMRDLNTNYQNTVPAHAILYSNEFKQLDLSRLQTLNKQVTKAEFRDFSLNRIEINPDVWVPLWLYGVADFQQFNLAKILPEQGKRTPDKGTILIERDGQNISNIRVGTAPRVRIGSNVRRLSVSGICFDAAQAPATQDAFIYAYTDQQTFSQITGLPSGQRLILRFADVQNANDVNVQIQQLSLFLAQQYGIKLTRIDVPKFNEHPHQWQLNTLLLLIGTIGLLAFVMAAVLVSQLMRAILASQVRQIGIMKAIGASTSQIFSIYLLILLLIGAAAGLLAVPLAVVSGYGFSFFVAGKLNFDILTLQLPVWVYSIMIISSLLMPVLLSLPVLYAGTRVSVREAITDYGISGQKISLLHWNIQHWNLPYTWLLAFKNSFRNMARLSVTIAAMSLGVAIFSTGFNVRQSLWNLLSGLKNELRYDVQIALSEPISPQKAKELFGKLPNIAQMETWTGGHGEVQSKVVATDKGAGIVALPIQSPMLNLDIRQGRWLQPQSSGNAAEIIMNQQAWALYQNPAVGSDFAITLGSGQTVRVRLVGVAEQFEKPKIYFDQQIYNALANPSGQINTILFRAKNTDYTKVLELKANIENRITESDLKVLYVMSQAQRVKIIYDHLDIILSTIVLLSFLVLSVSAVGMASATGISIGERTREIGVMRAIGASPQQIYGLFVREGMIISILSIGVGLLMAYPLSQLAAVFFGNLMLGEEATLNYAFSVWGVVITLAVTVAFGWLASRIPAQAALKISTHQALSYE